MSTKENAVITEGGWEECLGKFLAQFAPRAKA